MERVTVLEQIQRDFPADRLNVQGFYLYVGERTRAFINLDADEVFFTRADSNRGRNYVVFLVMFLYNRFRLLPVPGSLSHQLISEIEIARVRSFHARMQRVGNGMGYYEYWDGSRWRVHVVPAADPDYRIQIPLPSPEQAAGSGGGDDAPGSGTYVRRGRWDPLPGKEEAWEPLEELEHAPEELPDRI